MGKGWVYRSLLALYIIALFLVVPLMPIICALIDALLSPLIFPAFLSGAVLFFCLISLGWLWRWRREGRLAQSMMLIIFSGALAGWIWGLRDEPPTRMLYFPLYAILAGLAFLVYGRQVRDAGTYLAAALFTALVGTLNEVAHWVLLDSHFHFGDVGLRAAAGILILSAIGFGIRPVAYTSRPSPRSARIVFQLAVALLLLLGACVSNTVSRVHGYADRIPALAFLKAEEKVMIEYGHRHHDPEIGVFYSRFTRDELDHLDRTRSESVAAILDDYPFPDREAEFLAEYPPARDPFVYEVRHRIDRRDRYLFYANRLEDYEQEEWWVPFLTIAYQEHRILELLFPRTWNASGYTVSDRNLNRMRAYHDPAASFHNETDRHLVAPWRETHFWGMIVVGLTLCWLWYRHHQRVSVS